jgi:hypothetical protein
VSRHGTPWGKRISENVIWYVVRNCAKLCHVNGGELEQIQFLLGHASVLTTERYLGCKQNLEEPVNDRFGFLIFEELRFAISPVRTTRRETHRLVRDSVGTSRISPTNLHEVSIGDVKPVNASLILTV